MGRYIVGRLLSAVPVLVGVTLAAFLMLQLVPGDPIATMLGQQGADPNAIAATRRQLGLDQPLALQYGRFLVRALRADLGRSILSHRPLLDQIEDVAPSTFELTLAALCVSIGVGVGAG